LESDEGARLKYLHTADLHVILTTQEEFHEPVIDGWAYAIAMQPQDRAAAIGGIHGQIRRIEIPSTAEK
tara:strand:+ start:346 stop:552 length:207 start_codon:yes stop_codon:yes gene_type:complete